MTFAAAPADVGKRLDHYLQEQLPQYSRSRLQSWIKAGRVAVNGAPAKASLHLHGGEAVALEPADLPPLRAEPEDLPLEILYEDPDVIAVNKAPGVVVHAGAGRHSGTLVNALLHKYGSLSQTGGELRPGIVHRIDRFTSGVLLVARNDAAHRNLAAQFSGRTVEKVYLALVHGNLKADTGRITAPIARDPVHRARMTARLGTGRTARTEYKVLQRFGAFTFLEVRIGTGRTHQIRVHLASIGHPVAGDTLYGAPASSRGRYFLHSHRISFTQPSTGERITVTAPLPADLEDWLQDCGKLSLERYTPVTSNAHNETR
jgi:23S rRNA pseudouridine1911/1915/1917 synthase